MSSDPMIDDDTFDHGDPGIAKPHPRFDAPTKFQVDDTLRVLVNMGKRRKGGLVRVLEVDAAAARYQVEFLADDGSKTGHTANFGEALLGWTS